MLAAYHGKQRLLDLLIVGGGDLNLRAKTEYRRWDILT
jgi:hypothetical protein